METFSFFFALVDPFYQVLSWPLAEWLDLSGILRQLPHLMEAHSTASSEQALTLHETQLETIQHAREGIVEHLSHLEKCLQVEQAFVHEPTPEDALASALRNLSARGHANRCLLPGWAMPEERRKGPWPFVLPPPSQVHWRLLPFIT